MILKKIYLSNVRSYGEENIDFGKGNVLLSGDIGAGKTSILMAIEFALFGLQPGQKGSSILRNGEDFGFVKMEFEVDDKQIIIERSLKRGKSISQDFAAITIDGIKQEIAVTELKSKVLELLNYPKEFAKKQNLLYKFTVYTPQEEMKQIILQDSKTRINTLRHIFGIDKYKKVIENSGIVLSKIKEERRINEAKISTFDQDKSNLDSKIDLLDNKNKELVLFEGELLIKKNESSNVKNDVEEVSEKRAERVNLEKEIEKNKILISTKKETIAENNKLVSQLKIQIQDLKALDFDATTIDSLDKDIMQKKSLKKSLDEKILDITAKINSLILKNKDNDAVKDKLKHIEVCPTCLQDVNTSYKDNILKKLDSGNLDNNKQVDFLLSSKNKISEDLNEIENVIAHNEKKIQELNILKIKLQGILEKESRLKDLERNNDLLNKDVLILEDQFNILKKSVLEMNKFDLIYQEKSKELDEALRQEKIAEIKVAELRKELQVFSIQIEELKKRIEQAEQIKKKVVYLMGLEGWLSDNFVPMVASVEKNVMNKLKSEFSKLFSDWFSRLVPDNFNADLDEDFTPVIEYKDHVLDYAYLSGGERTAIALAYRLALNQVINSLVSEIKTKGFIILDEPTDGFSAQQLDKMKEVFEELDVGQMIIVSHEQRMEDFVDSVIKFRKQNGISSIEI